ncbi:MAG: ABC transporter ATP-binding protein [candidate division WS1 bacterium]|jgi:ABC-2 type transport system ATP-binding protein|nr:ABC transporter ATP-binding protein [candidate division WS1 bacterium]
MEVEEGSIFGLVGPNGSGKTTTLKLLLGLIYPTQGSGKVFDFPLGSPEYKQRIGFLPEGPYFYDHLNAIELLQFYGGLFGLGGGKLEARIEELLRLVGMWDRREIRIRNYSRGMLQRIGVAQALINNPDMVFLDEPTAGLDPTAQIEMRDLMHQLRDQGKTVFLCSHLLKEMEPLCDAVVVLSRGVVRRQGRICDLLAVQSGRYQLRATGCANVSMQSLRDKALDLTVTGNEISLLVADQPQALVVAQEIADGGGTILEFGAQTRSLEDVFIEAVAAGGSD